MSFVPKHDPNRPYRVGMDRPQGRVLTPDEIYPSLRRGPSTSIPAEFGWTWNPVNGLGGVGSHHVGSALDDLFRGIVSDGSQSVEDRTSQAVEDVLRSGPGKELLTAVENKAAVGVTKVVKAQAPNLMLLAVAGGAIGGTVAFKLGKAGTIAALLVAGWAGYQLLNAKVPK